MLIHHSSQFVSPKKNHTTLKMPHTLDSYQVTQYIVTYVLVVFTFVVVVGVVGGVGVILFS